MVSGARWARQGWRCRATAFVGFRLDPPGPPRSGFLVTSSVGHAWSRPISDRFAAWTTGLATARSSVSSGVTASRAKKSAHAAEQNRPDVLKRRWACFESQPDLDPDRPVFIDETWAKTNMARTHGRAPRGERLRAAIPHGHWQTTTFVAGLRTSGIVAPMVLDGPINSDLFQTYVEQVLVPTCDPATSS
jgi:hypothetical protein